MASHLTELGGEDEGKEYDEMEVDLAGHAGEHLRAHNNIDSNRATAVIAATPPRHSHMGSGSGLRGLRRGERCGRCFRRRVVRCGVVSCSLFFHIQTGPTAVALF